MHMRYCTVYRDSRKLTPEKACEKIIAQVLKLRPELNKDLLIFYTEKIIAEVRAYCHLKHFPQPLIYAAAESIIMTLAELEENDGAITSSAPLSKIKQDDTEFTFAVNSTNAGISFSDLVFENLKPRLNLFRRMIAW